MQKMILNLAALCVAMLLVCSSGLFAAALGHNPKAEIEKIQKAMPVTKSLETEVSEVSLSARNKAEVKKLQQNNAPEQIQPIFVKDIEKIDSYIAADQIREAANELAILKKTYMDITGTEDYLLFYQGLISSKKGLKLQAITPLEQLVARFKNSDKFKEGLVLLQELYFLNGYDEKLIYLHTKHPSDVTEKQKFMLANAYYNTNDLAAAQDIFATLTKSPEYGFRSNVIMAMITLFKSGIQASIDEFLILAASYPTDIPGYDVIYLSLARLYHELDDMVKAIYCYNQYIDLHPGDVSNEILYELVLLNLKAEDSAAAIDILTKILEGPKTSEYYSSANYLLSVIYKESGDLEKAKDNISTAIGQTEQILEILDTKHKLVNKQKQVNKRIALERNPARKAKLQEKSKLLNDAIVKTSAALEGMGVGLSDADIYKLLILEEEYFYYNQMTEKAKLLIQKAGKSKNNKIPTLINNSIDNLEESIVLYKAMLYLLNMVDDLEWVTVDDFTIAYSLVTEIQSVEEYIASWKEIKTLALKKNKTLIYNKAQEQEEILGENLAALTNMAEHYFPSRENPSDLQLIIVEEIKSTKALQKKMDMVKDDMAADYNKKIVIKLNREQKQLNKNSKNIKNKYQNLLSGLQANIKTVNQHYNYTLLDIMYSELKNEDQDYELIQAEYKLQKKQEKNKPAESVEDKTLDENSIDTPEEETTPQVDPEIDSSDTPNNTNDSEEEPVPAPTTPQPDVEKDIDSDESTEE